MKLKPIIIDKCYLQGTSMKLLQKLSEEFQLLMPDVLFYELISCGEPHCSRCFKKLPQGPSPIPIVKHVGALLKRELHSGQPAGLPSDNLEVFEFIFNPNLSKGAYELSASDKRAMSEIEDELKSDISNLLKKSQLVPNLFPNIKIVSTEKRKKNKEEIEAFIASGGTELRRFLSNLKLPNGKSMPDENVLNESWALFRWLQVQLLFSLDIYFRYGAIDIHNLTSKQNRDFEHDVLDAHYLIQGVMQRSFATKEKKLIRYFKLLCPEGILMTC